MTAKQLTLVPLGQSFKCSAHVGPLPKVKNPCARFSSICFIENHVSVSYPIIYIYTYIYIHTHTYNIFLVFVYTAQSSNPAQKIWSQSQLYVFNFKIYFLIMFCTFAILLFYLQMIHVVNLYDWSLLGVTLISKSTA